MESTDTYNLLTKDSSGYQMIKNNQNIPPGLMQYKINPQDIINMDIENLKKTNLDYKGGNELENHTKENLLRLIPNTPIGNSVEWKLILVIKGVKDGEICLKGALRNPKTGEIAVMSSLNKECQETYKYRMCKSKDPEYKICQCKMIAPLLFWDELKNRLLTSF
jgi:hypothetical protein